MIKHKPYIVTILWSAYYHYPRGKYTQNLVWFREQSQRIQLFPATY